MAVGRVSLDGSPTRIRSRSARNSAARAAGRARSILPSACSAPAAKGTVLAARAISTDTMSATTSLARSCEVIMTEVGFSRTCAVTMNGKKGTMVERCVEAVPSARASFLVVDDSFGFTKMFTGYGFTAHFPPAAGGRTTVRIDTFDTPANPIAGVLNKLVLRRRLRSVVDELLAGLGTLAERRRAQPEHPTPPR